MLVNWLHLQKKEYEQMVEDVRLKEGENIRDVIYSFHEWSNQQLNFHESISSVGNVKPDQLKDYILSEVDHKSK